MKEVVAKSSSHSQGIQSLEHAFAILDCFKEANEPLSVAEVSRRMNMSKSNIHKYLTSFLRLGILTQNKRDFTYSFGSKLIELGFAALGQFDIVTVAEPYLRELRNQLNQSVVLAIWSEKGPVAVKYEKSNQPISIEVQLGIPYPVLMSAVGMCFAAFLPASEAQPLIQQEMARYHLQKEMVENELDQIRKNHLAVRTSKIADVPGSNAIASPVFDYNDHIVAAVGIIGFSGEIHHDYDSKHVSLLKETAKRLSTLS